MTAPGFHCCPPGWVVFVDGPSPLPLVVATPPIHVQTTLPTLLCWTGRLTRTRAFQGQCTPLASACRSAVEIDPRALKTGGEAKPTGKALQLSSWWARWAAALHCSTDVLQHASTVSHILQMGGSCRKSDLGRPGIALALPLLASMTSNSINRRLKHTGARGREFRCFRRSSNEACEAPELSAFPACYRTIGLLPYCGGLSRFNRLSGLSATHPS